MKEFACRRGFKVNINDSETREVVDAVQTIDIKNNILLFPQCMECGYGRKIQVLESRKAPFNYYEIRTCKMRLVKG